MTMTKSNKTMNSSFIKVFLQKRPVLGMLTVMIKRKNHTVNVFKLGSDVLFCLVGHTAVREYTMFKRPGDHRKPVLRPEAVKARAISQLDQGFRLPDR